METKELKQHEQIEALLQTEQWNTFTIDQLIPRYPAWHRSSFSYALKTLEAAGKVKRDGTKSSNTIIWKSLLRNKAKTETVVPSQREETAPAEDVPTMQLSPSPEPETLPLTFVPSPEPLSPWDQIQKTVIDNTQLLEQNPGKKFDILTVGSLVYSVRHQP